MELKRLLALFEEPAPSEPAYDPVHLGAAAIGTLIVIGLMYWLLWTLLVYEGGLFSFGEGRVGNVLALLTLAGAVAALHRLYFAAKRHASQR